MVHQRRPLTRQSATGRGVRLLLVVMLGLMLGGFLGLSAQAVGSTTVSGWSTTTTRVAAGYDLPVTISVTSGGRKVTRSVQVQRKSTTTSSWSTLTRTTTSSAGVVTVALPVPTRASWQFRLVIPAITGVAGYISPVRTIIGIAGLSTTVSGWSTTSSTVVVGASVSVRVRVKTGSGYVARAMRLQRKTVSGSVWSTISSGTTTSGGTWTVLLPTSSVGTWQYRIVVPVTRSAAGAVTAARTLSVYLAPISCSKPMVLVFHTSLDTSLHNQVGFTLQGGGVVTVTWGGAGTAAPAPSGTGSVQTYAASPGWVAYTYRTAGIYTVRVCGKVTHFSSEDQTTLTKVTSFGDLGTTDYTDAFYGATHLTAVPTTLPAGVTNLSEMFREAAAFNQPIGSWNTSKVTDMSRMFIFASAFDQPIGGWNTGNVTDMSGMFFSASVFDQPIGSWDTSKVTDMSVMFFDASVFDQNIGGWNTGNVSDMNSMFLAASAFDQNIGGWNVGKVTDMDGMFDDATAFNQNIGGWNVTKVTNMSEMFDGVRLSTVNYDALLTGWAAETLQHKVPFSAGSSQYSTSAASARTTLVTTDRWSITDGGPA